MPVQSIAASINRAPDLRAQIQQAVEAASRRSTRYSNGGNPGAEVVESIDLDQLQMELSAILGQQVATAAGS